MAILPGQRGRGGAGWPYSSSLELLFLPTILLASRSGALALDTGIMIDDTINIVHWTTSKALTRR